MKETSEALSETLSRVPDKWTRRVTVLTGGGFAVVVAMMLLTAQLNTIHDNTSALTETTMKLEETRKGVIESNGEVKDAVIDMKLSLKDALIDLVKVNKEQLKLAREETR